LGWLVGSTLGDFKRLPSTDTATVLAIGAAGAWLGGIAADRGSSNLLSASPTLDAVLEPGATIGGARMQLAGALATYSVGRFSRSPRVAALGADLLRAQLLSQVMTAGIKMSVRRARPDGSQFSFPSGHTSVSFASATILQRHLGAKAGIPAYAVATYVAASRIQERRHFLSDVAFGAAIGIVAGRTVTVGRGEARFALTPTAVPGGAGVSLNWLGSK
jgi:membrane-associated phospholipid phosphatase